MTNPETGFADINNQWLKHYNDKLVELCPGHIPSPFQRAAASDHADTMMSRVGRQLIFRADEVHASLKESSETKTVRVQSKLP